MLYNFVYQEKYQVIEFLEGIGVTGCIILIQPRSLTVYCLILNAILNDSLIGVKN